MANPMADLRIRTIPHSVFERRDDDHNGHSWLNTQFNCDNWLKLPNEKLCTEIESTSLAFVVGDNCRGMKEANEDSNKARNVERNKCCCCGFIMDCLSASLVDTGCR